MFFLFLATVICVKWDFRDVDLHFPAGKWYWISFHGLLVICGDFLEKCLLKTVAHT